MDDREESFTYCDQCMRNCPVTSLCCENGSRRYQEVIGKEYPNPVSVSRKDSAFRRRIREKRKMNQ